MMEATKAAVQAGLSGKSSEPKKPALAARFNLKRKVDPDSKETTQKQEEKKETKEEVKEDGGGLSGLLGYDSSGSD